MDVDATPDAAPEPERRVEPFDAQPGPRAQLTAVVEVLSVLARSASSQTEVFDAVVNNARRLCGADVALIHLLTDDGLEVAHSVGLNEDYVRFAKSHPIPVDRNGLVGRVTIDRTTQQITDVLADPAFRNREYQRRGGFRTIMGAPMLIGDDVVGVLSVWRTEVDPFDARIASVLPQGRPARGALRGRQGRRVVPRRRAGPLHDRQPRCRALGDRRRLADGVRRGQPAVPGASGLRDE